MSSSRLLHLLDNLSWSLGRVRAEPAVLPAGWLRERGRCGKGRRTVFATRGRWGPPRSPRMDDAERLTRMKARSIPCKRTTTPLSPPSRRACLALLKGRPPRNVLFPVNPPKSGAPHSSAFAPTGQTASLPHPRSAPCPTGARQRRPTRRRRQAPARGPAAVCALSRPTRNAKKRPCPLLVGHGCVASEPTALAPGTAGHCRVLPAPACIYFPKGVCPCLKTRVCACGATGPARFPGRWR